MTKEQFVDFYIKKFEGIAVKKSRGTKDLKKKLFALGYIGKNTFSKKSFYKYFIIFTIIL